MTPTESFISHLIELRNRLLKVVLGFVLTFITLIPFANKIYALLAAPMLEKLPAGGQMIATAVTTPFFVPMKVAMMTRTHPEAMPIRRPKRSAMGPPTKKPPTMAPMV